MSATESIAQFLAETKSHDIPSEVIALAKRNVIDTFESQVEIGALLPTAFGLESSSAMHEDRHDGLN